MGATWHSPDPAEPAKISGAGWARVVLRGTAIGTVTFGGLLILLLLRVIERPLCGLNRPVTPFVTQTVCRAALWILGMDHHIRGRPMKHPGAYVANHCSWMDIFALNAAKRFYFVSKSEVARWPGIGWLARATGTVFIDRDRKTARAQTALFEQRLLAGHALLFFPEGTSSDGLRVLPFKTTLFQAFLTQNLKPILYIQPVSLVYFAPKGEDARFYGWWGDMSFGSHLLKTLAAKRQGAVKITYHDPVPMAEVTDRKTLARALEQQIRQSHSDTFAAGAP